MTRGGVSGATVCAVRCAPRPIIYEEKQAGKGGRAECSPKRQKSRQISRATDTRHQMMWDVRRAFGLRMSIGIHWNSVVVTAVVGDGNAARQGVHVGDVLLCVENELMPATCVDTAASVMLSKARPLGVRIWRIPAIRLLLLEQPSSA